MSGKEKRIDAKSVKVGEFIRILKANEEFLSSLSYENKNLVLFIKKLRKILKPLGSLDGEKFLEGLRNSLKVSIKLGEIEFTPLDELKNLISEEPLSTKELLYIAEKRLEIPTGMLKKMKKELIKSKILSTIQNIQKLDAIQKKASE